MVRQISGRSAEARKRDIFSPTYSLGFDPCNSRIRVSSGTLLNHFFTQAVWRDLLKYGGSRIYDAVLKKYVFPYLDGCGKKCNRQLILALGDFMAENFQNEYYFRNVLLRHFYSLYAEKPERPVALVQQKIAKSRADFIFLNGKAVVYEIKTDRDDLSRLSSQINDYYRAFKYVCVACSSEWITRLKKLLEGTPVGLLLLKGTDTVKVVKAPRCHAESLDAGVMFDVLRRDEFDSVLLNTYGRLPNVVSTRYYTEARDWFCKIPMKALYAKFMAELRGRNRGEWAFAAEVPSVLSALAYFWDRNESLSLALSDFLNAPYVQFKDYTKRKDGKNEVLPIF